MCVAAGALAAGALAASSVRDDGRSLPAGTVAVPGGGAGHAAIAAARRARVVDVLSTDRVTVEALLAHER